jgi:hypothetical protein
VVAAALGWLAALVLLPPVAVVCKRRTWPPFQERGVALLVLTGLAGAAWGVLAPAAANPGLYGFHAVEEASVEPERVLQHLLLPFGIGYVGWTGCMLIRLRNLGDIHLRGKASFSVFVQLPALLAPGLVISFLPGSTAPFALWALLASVLLAAHLMASIRLLPFWRDLVELLPTLVAGTLMHLMTITVMTLRLAGLSWANPDGGLHVLFPAVGSVLVGVHYQVCHGWLVLKLLRKDKSLQAQYAMGGGEGDGQSKSRWRKAGAAAILKMGARGTDGTGEMDEGAAAREGGIMGLLRKAGLGPKAQPDASIEAADHSSSSSSSSASSSSSSDESDGEAARPDGGASKPRPQSAGRGRGRGRGWNRSSRGRAAPRGRAGRVRLPPLQKASPGLAKAELQKLTPGQLMAGIGRSATKLGELVGPDSPPFPGRVSERVPGGRALAEDPSDDSSDSELDALQDEVKKFEAMVERKAPAKGSGGELRVRLHSRFVLPFIHFYTRFPNSCINSVLKRQCDRTLGKLPAFQGSVFGSGMRLDRMAMEHEVQRALLDRERTVAADHRARYNTRDDVAAAAAFRAEEAGLAPETLVGEARAVVTDTPTKVQLESAKSGIAMRAKAAAASRSRKAAGRGEAAVSSRERARVAGFLEESASSSDGELRHGW